MAVLVCCVVDPCGVNLSVHRSQPEDRLVVGISIPRLELER